MPRLIKKGESTLVEFLMVNLSAKEFRYPFATDLGWSKKKLTRYCNHPDQMTGDAIKTLADFFTQGEPSEELEMYLIEFFGCGANHVTDSHKRKLKAGFQPQD